MTSKLVCAYCGKEIDEGTSYDWEPDPDDPSIVFYFQNGRMGIDRLT